MTERRLLSTSYVRMALLALPLALAGWATGVEGAPPEGTGAAMTFLQSDTIVTRADSLRARILDRVRGDDTPPGDTVPDPTPADTIDGPDPDADSPIPQPLPTAAPGMGTGGESRSQVPPRLPSGADSIMRALSELPGYTAATYSGMRADFSALDRRLTLFGNPEIRARFSGQGADVEADTSIVYDEMSGRVRTTGPTLATFPGEEPVQSSSVVYDLTTRWATARDARTTYSEGQGNWIVQSNVISTRDDIGYSSGATFTSCDHDPPHSHFHAESMKVIADRVLIARNVRLYFDNVPVAWLPFMAQPMTSGRSSGLLTPGFSVNDIVRTSDGRNRRISNIGYYWAMSDYTDATLAMEWWSNQYTALTGSLRYRWAQHFLDGDVAMRRFWRDTGARDFAVSTRNRWEPMERTRVSLSGNYVTNTGLVRQNSLDPRELTSSIDSNAGIQHRFDWGNLSVSARRQQYLSDDRLEMTLPNASLSMNTRTLFAAPPQTATWYNNISLSGSSSFSRDVREFPVQPDTIFRFNRADNTRTQARLRGSMGLGNLSLSSQMNYRETVFPEVPAEVLTPGAEGMMVVPGIGPGEGLGTGPLLQDSHFGEGDFTDFSDATADWNLSLSYQQRLMGSSTLTPSLSVSGNMARVDSIPDATAFVSAPTRMSLSVNARTEVFGFYPGFRGFEAIRHKLSPGITYSYSPATTPTPLQDRVFGSRNLRVQNQVSISLNQTFEARVEEREEEPEPPAVGPGADMPDPGLLLDPDAAVEPDPDLLLDPDAAEAPDPGAPPLLGEDVDTDLMDDEEEPEDGGPRRAPQSRVVTLLGLNTSAVQYDIVQADSTGRFIDGFTTTRLSNTVRSDYLRGLSLSFAHSLFEESGSAEEGMERRLAPHLEQLSLSFSIDHRSGLVRAIGGILGLESSTDTDAPGAPGGPARPDGFDDDDDDFGPTDGFDQSQVMPGSSRAGPREGGMRRPGWDARLSYSLRRPRDTAGGVGGGARNQMVSASLSFQPTVNWDATWQTTYDVEENRFNDHILQLRRDLHEWEASFGFRQTASGNWSFQFDVSLRANRDLRFDYEQRNVDGRVGAPGEALGGF
jgi:hypothetical protein